MAYRFALTGCPAPAFALPVTPSDSATDGAYRLTAAAGAEPLAAGFTPYAFRSPWGKPDSLDARLLRGPDCALDVIHVFDSGRLFTLAVEAAARLLLRDAGVAPVVPATRVEQIPATELDAWAARAAADAR